MTTHKELPLGHGSHYHCNALPGPQLLRLRFGDQIGIRFWALTLNLACKINQHQLYLGDGKCHN